MPPYCDKFYLPTRATPAPPSQLQHAISQSGFASWNLGLGGSCAGLWAKTYAYVSVIGYMPTPTDTSNGIATPVLAQPGMLANCIGFHLVQPGESCADVAAPHGISVDVDGVCVSTDCQVASWISRPRASARRLCAD